MTKKYLFRTRYDLIHNNVDACETRFNRVGRYLENGVVWTNLRQLQNHASHYKSKFYCR